MYLWLWIEFWSIYCVSKWDVTVGQRSDTWNFHCKRFLCVKHEIHWKCLMFLLCSWYCYCLCDTFCCCSWFCCYCICFCCSCVAPCDMTCCYCCWCFSLAIITQFWYDCICCWQPIWIITASISVQLLPQPKWLQ